MKKKKRPNAVIKHNEKQEECSFIMGLKHIKTKEKPQRHNHY